MLGKLKALWADQRARRPWLDHVLRAWKRNGDTNASLLAGALTFFSFLALFPLVLLAVALAGYILRAHPETLQKLFSKIEAQAPGGLGDTLHTAVQTAIDKRAGVGVVGLVGVLLTGLGWISNLRQATEQVWAHPPLNRSFLSAKTADSFVLLGLGVGLILSVGLTAVGSALTQTSLKLLHLQDAPGAHWITTGATLAVAVLADMVIFGFLLLRLPRADVPREVGLRAALLAAVGFEILKVFGTYYIARVSHSPTASIFGSIIGVLVWLNLVYRFLLYCTAWTAVATPDPLYVGPLASGALDNAAASATSISLAPETTVRGTLTRDELVGPPGRRSVVITPRPNVPAAGLVVAALTYLRRRR